MKVERIQPTVTIKIEIDERLAEKVCSLLGNVRGMTLDLLDLFVEIDNALPNRTESFEDFFEGDVRCKSGSP